MIQRSQSGDLQSFGELVKLHQKWLRGWLRGQLRDWTAADDLAQDAFVTAFKKIKSYRGDGTFESWLTGIANNHFRNYIRKKREDYIGGHQELQALLSTESHVDCAGGDQLFALRKCMQGLKSRELDLLNDRYLGGKSVREIAAESGRGYSALTMHLHRIREALGNCIETRLNT